MEDINKILEKQREFYNTNKTKDVDYRIEKLKRLKNKIIEKQSQICEALKKDLGKASQESYMAEIGMVLEDLGYCIKHIKKWAKKEYHLSPIAQFPATSYRIAEPYGVVLILSPWNYPFLLTIEPLVGAIAAGNCAVVKPSTISVHVAEIMKEIIEDVFQPGYVDVLMATDRESEELLNSKFDYIFYTGSARVGKIVMEHAAKNLTPITLELGGKSPCIIDENSNYKLAAKRIIFGKLLNCGQTCVAPDYVFVHKNIKEEFIKYCEKYNRQFLGDDILKNENYPKMINQKHFDRIVNIIKQSNVIFGGKYDEKTFKIEPTLIDNKSFDSKAMEDEIFGPVLPIIEFEKIDDPINYINSNHKPLALYLFTNNKNIENKFLKQVSFGGGCINDTIIHLATSKMGFGGVGYSGMGEYHGKFSFQTFSNYKSIVKKSNIIDLPMRYHPYKKINDKLIRFFMK